MTEPERAGTALRAIAAAQAWIENPGPDAARTVKEAKKLFGASHASPALPVARFVWAVQFAAVACILENGRHVAMAAADAAGYAAEATSDLEVEDAIREELLQWLQEAK